MRETYRMVVRKYIPQRLFGFVANSQGEGFFHLGFFHCPFASLDEVPVLPIVGEEVDVTFPEGEEPGSAESGNDVPRAVTVRRVRDPVSVQGVVEAFNPQKGFGFVQDDGGTSYYLHRSEVRDGRIPLVSDRVSFYVGHSRGRPRACYVEVLGTDR